jgi:hypothetical protein
MEAGCGSHHLGRVFDSHGHDVRLMSPEYVRPYRALVERIVFSPEEGNPKRAALDLHGDLAGILALASETETGGKPPATRMVAGERSQSHYPRLSSMFVIPSLPAAV